MSISTRARSVTTRELLSLYEVSSKEDQKELAEELFVRLRFVVEHPAREVNSYNHVYNR